jgi:hypothetical protein
MNAAKMFDLSQDARTHSAIRGCNTLVALIVIVVVVEVGLGGVLGTTLLAQDPPSPPTQQTFPDTDALISRVASHQKDVEALLTQYTFTDKQTQYALDKTGKVRSQHTDTYYITPTPYEVFTLHISHDGKPLSQQNLEHQEKEIENKLKAYERKAQKNPDAKPRDALLFADIILKSKFEPLRWEDADGTQAIVYSFAAPWNSRRQDRQ